MKKYFCTTVFFVSSLYAAAQPGWYAVPNAPLTSRFEDVSLIGNTAWVADNNNPSGIVVYKTSDKGDTWFGADTISNPTSSIYIRSVEFINDSIGLLGALTWQSGSSLLYRTTDGGSTFTPVSSPAFASAVGICGMAHYGNTFIGVGIYDGQANFFKSTDAGLTWSKTDLSAQMQGLVDCYMVNDSVYMVSGLGHVSQQNSATILRTTNGGITWAPAIIDTDPFGYCWKMNFLPNGKGVGSIQESEHIFITNDFGANWTIETVGNCDINFGGVAFLNDTLGWVGNQYTTPCFYETTNGGSTWTQYTFGESVDRMVVLDSTHVMAVGATIYKYSSDSVTTKVFTPAAIKYQQHSLTINPNKASDFIDVNITLSNPTLCSVFLLNSKQQIVKQLYHKQCNKGNVNIHENIAHLPAGSYMIYVTTFQRHIAEKFIVVH